MAGDGFLILCPEPRRNSFFDVLERLLLVPALRDAPGKCGAFGYNPAIFSLRESYVECHASMLASGAVATTMRRLLPFPVCK